MPDEKSPDPKLGENITKALEEADTHGKEVLVVVTKAMDTECITSFRLGTD